MRRREALGALVAVVAAPVAVLAGASMHELAEKGKGRARYRRDHRDGLFEIEVDVHVSGTSGRTFVFERAQLNPDRTTRFDI